jgi:hypothetical protein
MGRDGGALHTQSGEGREAGMGRDGEAHHRPTNMVRTIRSNPYTH